jgi:hypothetical protein
MSFEERFYAVRQGTGRAIGSRAMALAAAEREVSVWREHIGPAVVVPATPEVAHAVRTYDQETLGALLAEVPQGYYASVESNGKRGLLLGPYGSKSEAEAHVPEATRLACQADDRAQFYAYGTARIQARPGQALPQGKLNSMAEAVA